MWFITHATSGERFYLHPSKPKHTVGRVGTDLELQGDICVSRSHAIFHVVESEGQTRIELEDMGSKYGTFYNKDIDSNTPLEKGYKCQLKSNDTIRFGRLQNVWKVEHISFITVTSSLSKDDISQVTRYVSSVGGKVIDQWSPDCTHLTMNDPSVTVKLVHALLDQKPVVTTNYWSELSNAVAAKKTQLPNPELYRPSFAEVNIDVGCKPERRCIFKGLTFVFLCRRHFDTYGPIVNAAGGTCKEITAGVQKAFLVKNNVVVVQYIPGTQTQSSQTINEIAAILQSHSKRIIPEYEIGLAIIHCSTAEYCNPQHKIPETMPQTVPYGGNSMSIDLSENVNTQSLDFEIPETNDNLVTSTPYNMVPPNIDEEDFQETMPNMRISETPAGQPLKRKHTNDSQGGSDDDDDLFQFSKKTCNTNDHQQEEKAQAEDIGNKSRAIKRSMFSDYYEKNQPKNKTMKAASSNSKEGEEPSTSNNRKRPHIQVLGEEDGGPEEDDLFCFGDTHTTKKKRSEGEADDLFEFKDPNNQTSGNDSVHNEDSGDMVQTQQFVVVVKPKKNTSSSLLKMPKPNILPRKISSIDWISGSLGKIKIKNENSATTVKSEGGEDKQESGEELEVKQEPNGDECVVKQEPNGNDLTMTDDHRKWLESLKDAIDIKEVSLISNIKINERSHYKYKNNHNPNGGLNGTLNNFKTFVKKYQSPSQTTSIQLHIR